MTNFQQWLIVTVRAASTPTASSLTFSHRLGWADTLGVFSSRVLLAKAEKCLVNLLHSLHPSPAPPSSFLVFPSSLSDFRLFLVCPYRVSFCWCRIPEASKKFWRPSRRQGVRSPQVIFFILSSPFLKRGKRKYSVFSWIWLVCVGAGAEPRSRPLPPIPAVPGGCSCSSDSAEYADMLWEAAEAGLLSCEWNDPEFCVLGFVA